jgi:hypothetical protein
MEVSKVSDERSKAEFRLTAQENSIFHAGSYIKNFLYIFQYITIYELGLAGVRSDNLRQYFSIVAVNCQKFKPLQGMGCRGLSGGEWNGGR